MSKFFNRKLLGEIWRLAWPTVVYSLLQNLIGLVDMLMVGRLGSAAISAVGLSRQIIVIIMVLVLSITTGATTPAAQFYGRRDRALLSRAAAQVIMMAAVTGLALGSLGFVFTPSCLSWIGARAEVLHHGVPYMRILFAGMVFLMTNFAIRALLLGAGDSLTPLKIAAFANIINVVADYVLIFGVGPFPKLGVAGAACGSVIARTIAASIGIGVLLSGRFRVHLMARDLCVPMPGMIYRVLRIGVPAGIQGLFRNGARVLLFRIIADTAHATAAVAAASIGFQMRMASILPALGIQVAVVSLVGRRIGSGRMKEAEKVGWEAVKTCLVLMSGIGAVMFLLPDLIVGVFFDARSAGAQRTIELGRLMLRFFAVDQLFAALSIVGGGILTGAGDTRPPLLYTIIGQWLVMLPLSCLLVFRLGWDLTGVCVAFTLASGVQLLLTLLRVRGGKWQLIRVY